MTCIMARGLLAMTLLLCAQDSSAMRVMEFLEKYDLNQLTYVGMNSDDCGVQSVNSATVLDPEGLPHLVRRGNLMGLHYGVVTRITEGYIQVVELHQDDAGNWLERVVALPIEQGRNPRARAGYEQDRALRALAESGALGRQLKERLVLCRELYGKDTERLACFDEAVGSLF